MPATCPLLSVWDLFVLLVFQLLVHSCLTLCPFRELDSGLAEAVSTLIWAAPRLQAEVAELKMVSSASCVLAGCSAFLDIWGQQLGKDFDLSSQDAQRTW